MSDGRSGGGSGYKRPPVHTQYRPGQSGNPRGRPKQSADLRTALMAELAETISTKEQDRTLKRTKLQALTKTLVDAAVGGNMRAVTVLFSILGRATASDERAGAPTTAEDQEILEDYISHEIKRRDLEGHADDQK